MSVSLDTWKNEEDLFLGFMWTLEVLHVGSVESQPLCSHLHCRVFGRDPHAAFLPVETHNVESISCMNWSWKERFLDGSGQDVAPKQKWFPAPEVCWTTTLDSLC